MIMNPILPCQTPSRVTLTQEVKLMCEPGHEGPGHLGGTTRDD